MMPPTGEMTKGLMEEESSIGNETENPVALVTRDA